ncbi:M48 family metalloprotease [Kiloniella sp. b19]|uniref:M48 family metalloprotease n=1 Tax=Kiloniella sp. GXU_MW_B19 TaxID=3141326 RepID=UPI0031E0D726
MKRTICAVMTGLLLVGCASPRTATVYVDPADLSREEHKQKLYAIEKNLKQWDRVNRLGIPLLVSSVDFCDDDERTAYYGFSVWNEKFGADDQYQPLILQEYGLSEVYQIRYMVEGSPADAAGLKAGDRILEVGGQEIWSGQSTKDKRVSLEQAFRTVYEAREDYEIRFERDGHEDEVTLAFSEQCSYGLIYKKNDSEINAYADGENVHITAGINRYLQEDNKLSLVIAHEIAHNAMGHLDAKRANAAAGQVGGFIFDIALAVVGVNTGGAFSDLGGAIGATTYSQEFESEADYVGMYIMARAKLPYHGVEELWRDFAVVNDKNITHGTSHPSSAERYLKIAAYASEIDEKILKGEPLEPNYKEQQETGTPPKE